MSLKHIYLVINNKYSSPMPSDKHLKAVKSPINHWKEIV